MLFLPIPYSHWVCICAMASASDFTVVELYKDLMCCFRHAMSSSSASLRSGAVFVDSVVAVGLAPMPAGGAPKGTACAHVIFSCTFSSKAIHLFSKYGWFVNSSKNRRPRIENCSTEVFFTLWRRPSSFSLLVEVDRDMCYYRSRQDPATHSKLVSALDSGHGSTLSLARDVPLEPLPTYPCGIVRTCRNIQGSSRMMI